MLTTDRVRGLGGAADRGGLLFEPGIESGALTKSERFQLHALLGGWYYKSGNGMLLAPDSRNIFFKARHNLTCPTSDLDPPKLLHSFPDLSEDQQRGCLSIRQLSLLRTQLKGDLAIYGPAYLSGLRAHEFQFLAACKVHSHRQPWRSLMGRVEANSSPLSASGGDLMGGQSPDLEIGRS